MPGFKEIEPGIYRIDDQYVTSLFLEKEPECVEKEISSDYSGCV